VTLSSLYQHQAAPLGLFVLLAYRKLLKPYTPLAGFPRTVPRNRKLLGNFEKHLPIFSLYPVDREEQASVVA
jgi:hypothetical protein